MMAQQEQDTQQFPDYRNLPHSPGFWQNAMKRFRRSQLSRLSFQVILFFLFIAVFADFLAYDKPIFARYKGKTYFPVVYDYLAEMGLYTWEPELVHARWSALALDASYWPLVRYKPDNLDRRNARCISPFAEQRVVHWKYWHFLGTDRDGRDVLSGLIHGTRISLSIGVVAVGIASVIGIILGAFAGFFGDNRLRLTRAEIIFVLVGILLAWFYAFQARFYILRDALAAGIFPLLTAFFLSLLLFIGIIVGMGLLARPLRRVPWLGEKKFIWVDIFISRIVEVIQSLPTLLLLITISGIVEKSSIYLTMVIIGVTSWTGIARYTRGEMLRTRSMDYIQAARSMGFSQLRILFRHALPNSLAPVLVAISFGIAGAILMESSLSFLSIGVPEDMVTWGTILSEARSNSQAWWLAIFPGMAIFLTVTVFNLLGESLHEALDPRLLE